MVPDVSSVQPLSTLPIDAPVSRFGASVCTDCSEVRGLSSRRSAQHGEVVGVDGEPELRLGLLGQTAEQGIGASIISALLADEVPMRGGGQVVGRRPVPEVGVHDAPSRSSSSRLR